MPVQINFLRQRRKKLTAQQERDKRYAMYSGYATAVVFAVIIVVVIAELLLQRSIDSIQNQQRAVEASIQDKAAIEREYLILGDKLAILQELVKGKGVKQEALEFFSTLFAEEDVELSQVVFSKENIIQFDVQTTDVFQYRRLLTRLQGTDVLEVYPRVSVTDLNREKSGRYISTITVNLAEKEEEVQN